MQPVNFYVFSSDTNLEDECITEDEQTIIENALDVALMAPLPEEPHPARYSSSTNPYISLPYGNLQEESELVSEVKCVATAGQLKEL